jgi:mannose-6-phosphate isomerase
LAAEGLSQVEIAGESYLLSDLFARFPEAMLGAAHVRAYGPNTQFLLKFLDAAVRLHLQGHPTVEFAQKHLNSNAGKTEAYIILSTRAEVAEPYIYLGFQNLPALPDFRQAILDQDSAAILACFEKIPIQPGDVFIVPGGMPHANGEGVFMIEIMEPTDFAVRIEFERGGYVLPEAARFMGRDVDFALSMFQFEELSNAEVRRRYFQKPRLLQKYDDGSAEYSLIDERATSCFRVKKLVITDAIDHSADSFYVGIVTKGSGRVQAGNLTRQIAFGDRFLTPFQTQTVRYEADAAGLEIVCTLPPLPK